MRIFAALFYLALAYLLTPVHSGSLSVLMMTALLYWFFLHRQFQRTRYLRDNLLLLGIIAVIVLVVFWQMVLPLLLLGLIFWVLVWRVHGDAPYFVRYHLLTGLIVNVGLVLGLLILQAVLDFAGAVVNIASISLFPGEVLSVFGLISLALIWGAAIYLAVNALMGRTPYIPFVSAQVRTWA